MADYFDNIEYDEVEVPDLVIDETNIDSMCRVMPLPDAKDFSVRVLIPIHQRVGKINETRYKLWSFLESHSTLVYGHSGVFVTSRSELPDEKRLDYDHRIWEGVSVTTAMEEDYIDCGFNHGFDTLQFFEYLKAMYDAVAVAGAPEILIYYSENNYWHYLHCHQEGKYAALINCDDVLSYLKGPKRGWCMTYEESILLNTTQHIIKSETESARMLERSGEFLPSIQYLPNFNGMKTAMKLVDMARYSSVPAEALKNFSFSYADFQKNEGFTLLIYPASRVFYGEDAHIQNEDEKRKVWRRVAGAKHLKVKNVAMIHTTVRSSRDDRGVYNYGALLSLGTYPLRDEHGQIFDFVKIYAVCCFECGRNSRSPLLNKKGKQIEQLCWHYVPKEKQIRPVLVSDRVMEDMLGPDWLKPVYTEQPVVKWRQRRR